MNNMNISKERLQQIKQWPHYGCDHRPISDEELMVIIDEILSIRSQLAELQKQEPVAMVGVGSEHKPLIWLNDAPAGTLLYAAPAPSPDAIAKPTPQADSMNQVPIYQYQSEIYNEENGETERYWDDCDFGFYSQYAEDRRRVLYAAPVPQAVPPAYVPTGDLNDYYAGWNNCRAAMLQSQPAIQPQAVPDERVTAEHRRVIEILLKVCGCAFELMDDGCQMEVNGEPSVVVPFETAQSLSEALDEIENSLSTEDDDRPNVFLAWSAMPRSALKSLIQQPINDAHGEPSGNYPVLPDAIRDVIAERQRQIEEKGWTTDHDDCYIPGVLCQAGACYALAASAHPQSLRRAKRLWPWSDGAFKPFTPEGKKKHRGNLIKAAALILAEIERIDRAGKIQPMKPERDE